MPIPDFYIESYASNVITPEISNSRRETFDQNAKGVLEDQYSFVDGTITDVFYNLQTVDLYLKRAKALASQIGIKNLLFRIQMSQYTDIAGVPRERRNQTVPVLIAYGYEGNKADATILEGARLLEGLGTLNFGTIAPPFLTGDEPV